MRQAVAAPCEEPVRVLRRLPHLGSGARRRAFDVAANRARLHSAPAVVSPENKLVLKACAVGLAVALIVIAFAAWLARMLP